MTRQDLRQARDVKGRVPASLYGKSLGESFPVFVERVPSQLHKGHVCQMKWDGKPIMATIDQIQREPVSRKVIHMSLHAVEKGEDVTVELPLKMTGQAAGEKEGGVTTSLVNFLTVSGVPGKLPESIEIDVSGLGINDSITLEDINLPEGVSWKESEPDQTLVTCKAPQVLEESTEESSDPEVIGETTETNEKNEESSS